MRSNRLWPALLKAASVENEHAADDDGKLDAAERGKDVDLDGISDLINADMNNDGRPDFLVAPCAWTTSGGSSARAGVSKCNGSTAATPKWTSSQVGTPGDGVTTDRNGTSYINATTSIFLQQSVVAVASNGTVKWTAPMAIAPSTPIEVVESADLVAVGDINGEVLAFDSTGTLAWKHYTDFPVRGVVARGTRVYASTWLGGLYAIDAFTGRRLWQQTSLLVPWGVPSVSADGATLYVTYDLSLVAIDAATGSIRWNRTFPMTFLNALTIGANGDLYMGVLDLALYRFSGATGAQVWRFPIPFGNVVGQPIVDGTNIYFGSDNDNLYALRDGATPTTLWTRNLASDVVGIPVKTADGTIYAGTSAGKIHAINGTNGTVLWQKTAASAIGSIISIGDKRTLFTDRSGKLYSY